MSKTQKAQMVAVKCGRCDGRGAIASFTTRYSGKCFACGGSGKRLMTKAAFEKKQALMQAAEEQAAAQRAMYPICKNCGYATGGADSWNGVSCKCVDGRRQWLSALPA
jgi:hypothetical protein